MGSSSDNTPGESGRSAGIQTKWIVIGVIGVVALFLFKAEIGRLIDRTSSVSITSEGIDVKTVETALGKTVVSAEPVKAADVTATGIVDTKYVSQADKFEISWPDNVNWSVSDTYGQQLHQMMGLPSTVSIPMIIMSNQTIDDFTPNIIVSVEQVQGMDIAQYIDSNLQMIRQMGWEVLSSSVDATTQAAFVVLRNSDFAYDLLQFQRYVVTPTRAYVVTASQLPPESDLSPQLRNDLRNILNSFSVLK